MSAITTGIKWELRLTVINSWWPRIVSFGTIFEVFSWYIGTRLWSIFPPSMSILIYHSCRHENFGHMVSQCTEIRARWPFRRSRPESHHLFLEDESGPERDDSGSPWVNEPTFSGENKEAQLAFKLAVLTINPAVPVGLCFFFICVIYSMRRNILSLLTESK